MIVDEVESEWMAKVCSRREKKMLLGICDGVDCTCSVLLGP